MTAWSVTAVAILGMSAALALVGIVTITIVAFPQEVEAGCERGSGVNTALANSGGKCFDRGTL